MAGSDPVLLESFDSQRGLLTPVPTSDGVVVVRQDGTAAAFDLSARERWVASVTRPGQPPALRTSLIALGQQQLLLDDHEQWSSLNAADGMRRWGPVPYGSLRHARRSPDNHYWAYVEADDAAAVAALDAGSGYVAVAGRRETFGTVIAARAGHLLAIEHDDLVRLDLTTEPAAGATVTWRRSLARASNRGTGAPVDAAEAVEIGNIVVVPLVGYGLVAFDHDGHAAWELELGAYSAPAIVSGNGVLHVLAGKYLRLDVAVGQVQHAVDLAAQDAPPLGQVHSPRMYGERIFAVDSSGLLFCIDPARERITWSFATQSPTPRTCGLALAEGQLWTLDLAGRLYGFRLP